MSDIRKKLVLFQLWFALKILWYLRWNTGNSNLRIIITFSFLCVYQLHIWKRLAPVYICLQATEDYSVHLFEDTNLCAIHGKRVTISKKFHSTILIILCYLCRCKTCMKRSWVSDMQIWSGKHRLTYVSGRMLKSVSASLQTSKGWCTMSLSCNIRNNIT